MNLDKPKEKSSTFLMVIAEAEKKTVRTPKDPSRNLRIGALSIG
jgi:hypothetical protein